MYAEFAAAASAAGESPPNRHKMTNSDHSEKRKSHLVVAPIYYDGFPASGVITCLYNPMYWPIGGAPACIFLRIGQSRVRSPPLTLRFPPPVAMAAAAIETANRAVQTAVMAASAAGSV